MEAWRLCLRDHSLEELVRVFLVPVAEEVRDIEESLPRLVEGVRLGSVPARTREA